MMGSIMRHSAHILLIFFCVLIASESFTAQDKIFKRAIKYFFQKKFEMAELLLRESIKRNPENVHAYSYLGDLFLKKRKYDGALNMYKKAIDINSSIAENYFRMGQIYYYKKLGSLAIDNFKKTLELDKSLKQCYFHIGLTYLMIERNKSKTIESWETFLRKAPEDPQYDKIRRVLELLKDPNFKIPPKGSDVSIEEALHLGGQVLKKVDRSSKDKQAGDEKKKTKKKLEEIYEDDDL